MDSEKDKKVDIIILNYNGKHDTLECLRSLKGVNYSGYRITVVDNGSADGSADAIAKEYPDANLIRSKENLRFGGGNNLAMKKSLEEGFEYVLLLNNDTVVESDFLSQLVKMAESDDSIGMTGPKMYYYDHHTVIWFAGGYVNMNIARMRHYGIGEIESGKHGKVKEVNFLNGACLLIKRKVLEDIGLFDEDFYLYGEDVDLNLRASKAGYKLMYQPRARIFHKVSRSSPPVKKLFYRYDSWVRLIRKHTPVYFRPLQYAYLIGEFIPLVFGFLRRQLRFSRSDA